MLGPLQVFRDGRSCAPSALKRRALLGLLLLSANTPVPVHRLIDELWQCDPPRSATATLQMYISGLRRTLDPEHGAEGRDARLHPLLTTEGAGYRLRVAPGALDLDRFRGLAAVGRGLLDEGRCEQAGRAFRSALGLWRGRAFGDLGHAGLLAASAARLDEERLTLLGECAEVALCQGRGADVVGELAELCARYPLRESFHEQLIRALCQADRRADALTAYGRARRTMIDDIGIEPGPALRAAQQTALAGGDARSERHRRCRTGRA